MTSLINITGINQNFPVAGVDNNSQGFRDNFAAIASQFTQAANEITSLQNTSVVSNANNNFNGFQVQNFVALQVTEQAYTLSTPVGLGTTQFNWQNGSYQVATTDAANDGIRTFSFANFGTSGTAARMTLQITLAAPNLNPNYFVFSAPTAIMAPKSYLISTVINTTTGSGFVAGPVEVDAATGAITAIPVASGGTNYSNGDTVSISGGGGFGATATLTIAGGVITNVNINSSWPNNYGYTNNIAGALGNGVHLFSFVTYDGGNTVLLENYQFFM